MLNPGVFSEKELVMNMIRAVTSSQREFVDGYNLTMRSPIYEDQLLQQQEGLDVEEIQKYNEEKKREKEQIEKIKKLEAEIEKKDKPK